METNKNHQITTSNDSKSIPSSPTLTMHKNSHMIPKPKPKIRIIHIFAPEIIKTDVENFRELVQRLTGKPEQDRQKCSRKRPRRAEFCGEELPAAAKKIEVRSGKVLKEEEGMWDGEKSGGFLNGFGDLEFGFVHELGDEFPLLPFDASHLHGFGEAQLA